MTLSEIKNMQAARKRAGEDYKPSKQRREELRQTMKVWGFYEEFSWGSKKPWWLRPLQVVGFVAAGVGLALGIYCSTLILFFL
jgi:hypothetical protein